MVPMFDTLWGGTMVVAIKKLGHLLGIMMQILVFLVISWPILNWYVPLVGTNLELWTCVVLTWRFLKCHDPSLEV
jgi:hypothetical protein